MLNGYTANTTQDTWGNWLSCLSYIKLQFSRVYDYSRAVQGVDYIFDKVSERDSRGYMTAQRRGVKVGDQILLAQDGIARKYRVQELVYYSSPSDRWIALLIQMEK